MSKCSKHEALALGALWGQDLVNYGGWEWVKLFFDGDEQMLCVVDTQRSYVVAPLYLFMRLYESGYDAVDVSPRALYNAIVARYLPKSYNGAYLNVTSVQST